MTRKWKAFRRAGDTLYSLWGEAQTIFGKQDIQKYINAGKREKSPKERRQSRVRVVFNVFEITRQQVPKELAFRIRYCFDHKATVVGIEKKLSAFAIGNEFKKLKLATYAAEKINCVYFKTLPYVSEHLSAVILPLEATHVMGWSGFGTDIGEVKLDVRFGTEVTGFKLSPRLTLALPHSSANAQHHVVGQLELWVFFGNDFVHFMVHGLFLEAFALCGAGG